MPSLHLEPVHLRPAVKTHRQTMELQTISNKYIDKDDLIKFLTELFGSNFAVKVRLSVGTIGNYASS